MGVRDENAPNALLTNKQRQRLADDDADISDAIRWKMHSRIRERLENTLYDFAVLLEHWDELNLGKVFEQGEMSYPYLLTGTEGMLYTLYRGHFSGPSSFEDLLEKAIVRAEGEMNGTVVKVKFKVKEEEWGLTKVLPILAERVDSGEVDSLRVSEMRALLEALAEGEQDFDEMVEHGEAFFEPPENDDE